MSDGGHAHSLGIERASDEQPASLGLVELSDLLAGQATSRSRDSASHPGGRTRSAPSGWRHGSDASLPGSLNSDQPQLVLSNWTITSEPTIVVWNVWWKRSVEPSVPVPLTLNVDVPLDPFGLLLKPNQPVKRPEKSGRVGSDVSNSKVPVCVPVR